LPSASLCVGKMVDKKPIERWAPDSVSRVFIQGEGIAKTECCWRQNLGLAGPIYTRHHRGAGETRSALAGTMWRCSKPRTL
jgi:hypothetical protein